MKKIFTLIASLLLATSAVADDALTDNILFNGSSLPTTRIPAIVKTKDGMLVGFTDRRKDNNSDIGSSNIDIVYRMSKDNGATWSTEQVAVAGGTQNANPLNAYGDAAVVCDRETGKLLIMCASGSTSYQNSNASCTRSGEEGSYTYSVTNAINVSRVYGTVSNGSITWEQPTDVTNDIYSLYYDDSSSNTLVLRAFFGSGRICQSSRIKVGSSYRLYAALTTNRGSVVVYSDDFGQKWNCLGSYSDQPASAGDEAKIEELPNGNVLLSCRASSGRIFNIYTYSDTENYAEGSWGTAGTLNVTAANCNGEILLVPNGSGYLALLSVPASSSRSNVGIYYKALNFTTDYDAVSDFTTAADWTLFPVSTKGSAYSTMAQDRDGNIAFVYEETSSNSSYYDIIFRSFSLSEITANNATKDDFQGFVGKVVTLKVADTDTAGNETAYYLASEYVNEKCVLKMVNATDASTITDYKYYWVVNQDPGSSTCYLSTLRGDGYIGGTKTWDYSLKDSVLAGIGCTDAYADQYSFTGFVKEGKSSSATSTAETMDGYALRFHHPTKGDRFVAVRCSDGEVNFYDHTAKGSTNGLANGSWTTDFTITEVKKTDETDNYGTFESPTFFGTKVTLTRSDDSYTLKDGEDYNYYATLKLPFAVALPDGVKAYRCTEPKNERNDVVGLETINLPTDVLNVSTTNDGGWTRQVDTLPVATGNDDETYTVLPRETAVLLCMKHEDNDADVTKTVYLLPMPAQTIVPSTGFSGTLGKKTITEYDPTTNPNRYILSKKNGRVAFYYKTSQNFSANKAHYIYTASSTRPNAISFQFLNDETTGISTAPTQSETVNDNVVYDLTGRRVSNFKNKGIYIKNGKKFLVK